MKCLKGFKKLFHKHFFIIVNGFYTFINMYNVDLCKSLLKNVVKRETFLLDRDMLLEVLDLYPNAFDKTLREYLQTWKGGD